MNNKDFISVLAQKSRFTTRATQQLVDGLIAELSGQLEEGESVAVPNFGSFEVKKKLERVFVNPSTGQRMMVPPKLVINFRPSKNLKGELREKGGEL